MGVVSHFGRPAMHTCRPAYPGVRHRLAARSLDPTRHTSRAGRGGSDPPRQGLGTGSGRGGNSHLVPALPGSLPHQQSLAGRPSERRFGTRRINPVLLRLPPLPKLPAPLSCQSPPACSLAPGHPHGGLGPDTATQRLPLRNGPRPGFTARPRGSPVRGGRPTCRESGCPHRACPLAFLQRTAGPVATRRGGWDGMHIPTSADATTGIEKGGSLRPRPPFPARHRHPGGRGTTAIRPTTCVATAVHVRTAIPRTSTTISHVRLHPVTDRIHSGPGSTSRVDSEHRLKTANQS